MSEQCEVGISSHDNRLGSGGYTQYGRQEETHKGEISNC